MRFSQTLVIVCTTKRMVENIYYLAAAVIILTTVSESFSDSVHHCVYHNTAEGKFANCSGQELKDVPSDIDNDTVILDLSHNTIKSLLNNSFEELVKLEKLDLSNNKIRDVDMCSFCSLAKLYDLDISYNRPGGLKLIRNLTYGLQFTNITDLKLTHMEDPTGTGKLITNHDLEFARYTSIKRLNTSGNMMETFETGSINYLPPFLEEVDVSDNRPVLGKYLRDFYKMEHLRVFIADKLNTYHPIGLFKDDLKQKTQLGFFNFKLPWRMEEFYCRSSMIPFDIPHIYVHSNNSLRRIELKHNALSKWLGSLHGLNKLEHLDLSVNFCEAISDNFFINLTSLTSLSVRANFIGYVIESKSHNNNESGCQWLKPLTKLTSLDFYINKIRKLPPKCFSSLRNLEYLNLKENSLTDWEVEIEHMPNISFIDLSGNSIDGFPKATRDHLSEVSKRRNVTINLSGNELECFCDDIDFLEWYATVNINFVGKETYTCRNEHWKKVNMTDVKHIIDNLKKNCADYKYLNTVLSVLIGCFLLIILYGIYYRYKWKLSYVYYMTWGRYNLLHESGREQFCYDAYISYAEEETDFVEGQLANNLEELHGLSLYLFDRDCKPGHNINATIVDKIEKSFKTILLITNSYIKDERCKFELNMAYMKKMYRAASDNSIYVVVLESLPHKKIPLEILNLCHAGLYMEYPNDPQGNAVFWERLKNTIKPSTEVI